MKTNKQFINEIYEKYDEYNKEKQENKQRSMRKIINMVAVFVVLISSLIVFSKKEAPNPIQNIDKTETNVETINLETVGSFKNFYEVIKNKYPENEKYGYKFNFENSITEDAVKSTETETLQTTRSETNTQVKNVDEADIVKVDNKNIYYISEDKIVIIDAQTPETCEKISEINYKEDKFYPSEIYVAGNKLIVIGNETGNDSIWCKTADVTEDTVIQDVARIANPKTGIILYDITDIKEPKEIRRVMVEGNYVSSRMIENNIYFVANKKIYSSNILRKQLEDLNEDEYKPKYLDTVTSQEGKCINYDQIYCFEETAEVNYLMLVGLNIDNNEKADIQTFLGAGEYIYASSKNMYIAINKANYDQNYKLLGGKTNIMKFALENGKFIFKADGEVDGRVNNPFSMDENGDIFRIATTIGNIWNIDENTSNNLYILNDKLEEVGKLTGFAKEEKIYSVRYVGEKAYVVTFKQTDPLFVIDLSKPSNPQILGELKLPGYSTYLHPYDETHIIGFGYETKEKGTRVTTDGLKMVMFDVSDFTNPQLLFKVNITEKYAHSSLLYDHKALLYSKEKNIIGFPLYSYDGDKTNSRAMIYEIDLQKGFILKGEISHLTDDYSKKVERVVFVNNTYYTLSKSLVKATDMDSFQVVRKIGI